MSAFNGYGESTSLAAQAEVAVPNESIDLGQDLLAVFGGNNQPMSYLLQGVSVTSSGNIQGNGNSVGAIWVHDVVEGYNAFLTADPEDGGAPLNWDGSPSNGMPPFGAGITATPINDILNNDGSGRLLDEVEYEASNRSALNIGLIGYSHGSGMAYNFSGQLASWVQSAGPLVLSPGVVFAGTIDGVDYGIGADALPPNPDGWYVSAPLYVSPGSAFWYGDSDVNFYEPNGWYGPWGVTLPIHGVSMQGAQNIEIESQDHRGIAVAQGVLTAIELATDDAFYELSY